MKTPNLDREINDLAYYENNDELTEQGKNTINEFREIKEQLILSGVTFSSLEKILGKQTDFKLANEIKEIQAMEVFNYIVNEHNVKLTYKEWRKTVKNYYR